MLGTFRLEAWQEGPPGAGQGGLSSYLFSNIVGRDLNVRLHAPIPLESDLTVDKDPDGRYSATDPDRTLILSGTPADFTSHVTPRVTIDQAKSARRRTVVHAGIHAAPNCFSCGIDRESMGVHPGPLDDGRFATDLTPPEWALTAQGTVEPYVFWAALDCTAGVYVGSTLDEQRVVTANYHVTMHRNDIEPGTFALVAFPLGEGWDGRKRWAGSAAFDADGALIAEATSLWVSLDTPT